MLSGGERALTAVALLFAMLEVRPVPFCVLDEVDAALDEANIGRFADALRSLADQTQFIVITHNRGTIEAADALYGVTVGDDSVSRVISLRLDEAQALARATAASLRGALGRSARCRSGGVPRHRGRARGDRTRGARDARGDRTRVRPSRLGAGSVRLRRPDRHGGRPDARSASGRACRPGPGARVRGRACRPGPGARVRG